MAKDNVILLRSKQGKDVSALTTSIQNHIGSSSQGNKEKRKKRLMA